MSLWHGRRTYVTAQTQIESILANLHLEAVIVNYYQFINFNRNNLTRSFAWLFLVLVDVQNEVFICCDIQELHAKFIKALEEYISCWHNHLIICSHQLDGLAITLWGIFYQLSYHLCKHSLCLCIRQITSTKYLLGNR